MCLKACPIKQTHMLIYFTRALLKLDISFKYTVSIQIIWLRQKPADQDLHCFHTASESTVFFEITQLNWLENISECAILIYLAWQGLAY